MLKYIKTKYIKLMQGMMYYVKMPVLFVSQRRPTKNANAEIARFKNSFVGVLWQMYSCSYRVKHVKLC